MEYRGHQIFIIHPDSGFRNATVDYLREQEYESFGFGDTDPVALDNRRESVVFLFSGENGNWDCRTLLEALEGTGHDVHIVAIGDPGTDDCFTSFIEGDEEHLRQGILDYLESNESRGHRHFVRFGSQNASIATFDFHDGDRRYAGVIHDISVRGMSFTFRPEPSADGPRKVQGIHLNLPGHRCVVNGRLTTTRKVAGQIIHVLMFDEQLSRELINELHDFIYTSLSMKLSVH